MFLINIISIYLIDFKVSHGVKYNKNDTLEVVTIMGDTLKNRLRFSTTLAPEVKDRLDAFSKETDIPVSRIIERAVNEYLDKQEKKKSKR